MSPSLTNQFTMTNKGQLFFVAKTFTKGTHRDSQFDVTLPGFPELGIQEKVVSLHNWAMEVSQKTYIGIHVALTGSGTWSTNAVIQPYTPRAFHSDGVEKAARFIAQTGAELAVSRKQSESYQTWRETEMTIEAAVKDSLTSALKSSRLIPEEADIYVSAHKVEGSIRDPRNLAEVLRRANLEQYVHVLAAKYLLAKADARDVEALDKAMSAQNLHERNRQIPADERVKIEHRARAVIAQALGVPLDLTEAA